MLKHRTRLRETDARKPLDELIDRRAIFEVLEQRRDWHARAAEHPGATEAFRIVLDGFAGRPVNHLTRIAPGEVRTRIAERGVTPDA